MALKRVATHPFKVMSDGDGDMLLEKLRRGWTPDGLGEFLHDNLWDVDTTGGRKQRLEEYETRFRQAETGPPFTFEHEREKYKVDGTVK